MKKILIISDSYKECLSSLEVGECLKKGIAKHTSAFNVQIIPVADGGEGTLEAFDYLGKGEWIEDTVTGPLNEPITTTWLYLNESKTAIIESARVIGLPLVPKDQRNPLKTTTRGLGELIIKALNKGAQNLILGIGGSSTNDGGSGMLKALGIKLEDSFGNEIEDGNIGLGNLDKIDENDLFSKLSSIKLTVACDVTNPLTGRSGATYVYSPQKGATQEMVAEMESNMENFRQKIINQKEIDPNKIPGSGAAGGLGAAFHVFLGAELKPGFEIINDFIGLEKAIQQSDLIITGEGKMDAQSVYGKLPVRIAELARDNETDVIAVAGIINERSILNQYFSNMYEVISIAESEDDSIKNACKYLEEIGSEISDHLSK